MLRKATLLLLVDQKSIWCFATLTVFIHPAPVDSKSPNILVGLCYHSVYCLMLLMCSSQSHLPGSSNSSLSRQRQLSFASPISLLLQRMTAITSPGNCASSYQQWFLGKWQSSDLHETATFLTSEGFELSENTGKAVMNSPSGTTLVTSHATTIIAFELSV